jgi:DNA-binding MarR family transcriptional regulator
VLGKFQPPAVQGKTVHISRQNHRAASGSGEGCDSLEEDDLLVAVNVRLRLDEVADLEAHLLEISERRQPSQKELRRLARQIYERRRTRDRLLGENLFGEPAWDMLLALYYLPALGHMLTISGLCCCAGAPQTTALRWQNTLLKEGLIERSRHATDRRMQFVRLTARGRELLEGYLTRLLHCERTPRPGGQITHG